MAALAALTTLAASLLPLAGVPKAAAAVRPADQLTFLVRNSGTSHDGSYTLRCRPAGGDHPAPQAACAALERATSGGRNPFRALPSGTTCTMIYGGPATAHVTGTWHGQSVNARFKRANGCEVDRWNRLVPALPRLS
nr:SSI family serine proteinase inhibitor [Streptomyces albus]